MKGIEWQASPRGGGGVAESGVASKCRNHNVWRTTCRGVAAASWWPVVHLSCCAAQVVGMSRLQHLKLGSAPKLTDATVHHLSASCPVLESLGLVDCNTTDRAFDTQCVAACAHVGMVVILGARSGRRCWLTVAGSCTATTRVLHPCRGRTGLAASP